MKVFIIVGLLSIIFNLVEDIRNDSFKRESITGWVLGTITLTGLLYFVNTRKQIDYDDIKQTLYVVDLRKQTEIEIPVEKIDKILFSSLGFGRGNNSYLIIYRDFHNQKQKVRLFPILFDNSIKTIRTDTELKNPNLETRDWSIGWNELFD